MPERSVQFGPVRVFISSSNEPEAVALREELRAHRDYLNDNLAGAGKQLQVHLVEWQNMTPRQRPDGDVAMLFVEEALNCQAVIALLVRDLRPGTHAEIEAVRVLPDSELRLHVLLFPPEGNPRRRGRDLQQYLSLHRDNIFWSELFDYRDDRSITALKGTLDRVAYSNLLDPKPLEFEAR